MGNDPYHACMHDITASSPAERQKLEQAAWVRKDKPNQQIIPHSGRPFAAMPSWPWSPRRDPSCRPHRFPDSRSSLPTAHRAGVYGVNSDPGIVNVRPNSPELRAEHTYAGTSFQPDLASLADHDASSPMVDRDGATKQQQTKEGYFGRVPQKDLGCLGLGKVRKVARLEV